MMMQGPEHTVTAGRRIHGTLRDEEGAPLSGALVRAFDKRLRHEHPLGQAVTGHDGTYAIRYAYEPSACKQSPDLVVRAYVRSGTTAEPCEPAADALFHTGQSQDTWEIVATSDVFFAAPDDVQIDLLAGGGTYRLSEYEILERRIVPCLDGVPTYELTDDDVVHLARSTGVDLQHLQWFVWSHKRGIEHGIPLEVLYAFAREGLPAAMPALFAQAPAARRAALEKALTDSIVPIRYRGKLDLVETIVAQAAARYSYEAPALPGGARAGALLEAAGVAPELGRKLAALDAAAGGSAEKLWAAAAADPDLAQAIPDLQASLQLAAVARGHAPMIAALARMRQDGRIASVKDLAALTPAAWRELVARTGAPADAPGGDDREKAQSYAETLARTMEILAPTTALAAGMNRDPESPADVRRFFAHNPDLDLRAENVGAYLASGRAVLEGVQDPIALGRELAGVQRLFRLTPRYDEIQALRRDGVGSALAVATLGEPVFVARYGQAFGEARASEMAWRAQQIVATTVNLFMKESPQANGPELLVLPKPQVDQSVYGQLFGPPSACACDACSAIHGPAAYFFDTLAFIGDVGPLFGPSPRGNPSAPFVRRPDLGNLELSCDNTNTPLPYIDLVNEILEYAVLASQADPAPDPSPPPPAGWPQTSGAAEDLAVTPQHRIDDVYGLLAGETYAWSLPFDLANEEARGFLRALGVRREALMEAFQRPGGAPSDLAISLESLGISPAQWTAITAPAATATALADAYFAKKAPSRDLDTLRGNAGALLAATGLSYAEIVELVATRFVAGQTTLSITPPDELVPTCDVSQYLFNPALDDGALDRLHRFVRLRLAIGWSTADLDRALTTFGATALDDALIQSIAFVEKLREALHLDVSALLGLWDTTHAAASREAALGQALGLLPAEITSLAAITGIDPLASAEAAFDFVEAARRVSASRFSVAEIDYLLRDVYREGDGVAPTRENVDALLREIRAGLDKLAADEARVLAANAVQPAPTIDPNSDSSAPVAAPPKAQALVQQKVGPWLKLDTKATSTLLTRTPAGGTAPMAVLLALPGATDLTEARAALLRLWKAALVVRKLRLTGDRLGTAERPTWLFEESAGRGLLDLDALPPAAPADPGLFERFLHLVDLAGVMSRLPPGKPSLFAILDEADQTRWVDAVAARTGWPQTDVETLAGATGSLGLVFPDDYRSGRALVRLFRVFGLLRNLGASAASAARWIDPAATDLPRSAEIRAAAADKLGPAAFRAAARPIQDELRKKQRDALVAYLVSQQGFASPDALFEWFLIDVSMSDCLLTSRLKAAIGSAQLFVQRGILNLEQGYHPSPEAAREWATWRKSFRIWEANRKVFFYPENWIEPELRDDKTPFFRELETELMAREVTPESAEEAFRHYLEKLDAVARLEIVGMYHDRSEDGVDTLHVFGRTPGEPHVYHHRTYNEGFVPGGDQPTIPWSPWERVDLDIQGNHLIPVVHHRRLHLFWPIFTEKPEGSSSSSSTPPKTKTEIQLAWSEYKKPKWLSKKVTPSAPSSVVVAGSGFAQTTETPYRNYFLRAWETTADDDHPPIAGFFQQDPEIGDLTVRIVWSGTYEGAYRLVGCSRVPVPTGYGTLWQAATPAVVPGGMTIDYQFFKPNLGEVRLVSDELGTETPLLRSLPGPARVLYPHQYGDFLANDSFFFQDDRRTFFARHLGYHHASIIDPHLVTIEAVKGLVRNIPYARLGAALEGGNS